MPRVLIVSINSSYSSLPYGKLWAYTFVIMRGTNKKIVICETLITCYIKLSEDRRKVFYEIHWNAFK